MTLVKIPKIGQPAVICADIGGIYFTTFTPEKQREVNSMIEALVDEGILTPESKQRVEEFERTHHAAT